MKTETLAIVNKLGLHARASAKFVTLAAQYKCDVTLGRNGQHANGKSIMGIMMLAAGKGAQVELTVNGEDEDQALAALRDLIANRFGEDE
ncbi:MAG: HPr family phosphocarrier protein [Gammaproteobacteria bacterium]|nr:HPr family phosphocarrier protein [Gammaproteobacteria bacterium]